MFAARVGASTSTAHPMDTAAQTVKLGVDVSAYIDLPNEVNDYEGLSSHQLFAQIKENFLKDIDAFKTVVAQYIGDVYAREIDVFSSKIREPDFTIFGPLYLIYRDTRYQIFILHQFLYKQLEQFNSTAPQPATSSSKLSFLTKDSVSHLLHDCLNGIELCLPGVHGRFMKAYQSLEAAEDGGLASRLVLIKDSLLRSCIQNFLLKIKQENPDIFPTANEVHVFHGFYNFYCNNLSLDKIEDELASSNFNPDIANNFLLKAKLETNDSRVYRQLTTELLEIFKTFLNKYNASDLLSQVTSYEDLSLNFSDLDAEFLDHINLIFNMTGKDKRLMFNTLLNQETEHVVDLSCMFEKLLVWAIKSHHSCEGTVISCKSKGKGKYEVIGSLENSFFWVAQSSRELSIGSKIDIEEGDYRSLTLKNLKQISLSQHDHVLSFELLSQAIQQSDSPKETLDFFMSKAIGVDLRKTTLIFQAGVSLLIREKMLHNPIYQSELEELVLKYFKNKKNVLKSQIGWLFGTPILEGVLSGLKNKGININNITKHINLNHALEFSLRGLREILSQDQLENFCIYAFRNNMHDFLELLFLTEKCNSFISSILEDEVNLLVNFIINNKTKGAIYLIDKYEAIIHRKCLYNCTALMHACYYGREEIVQALLEKSALNAQDVQGNTALAIACAKNHTVVAKIILNTQQANLSLVNYNCSSALMFACRNGNLELVSALLEHGANLHMKDITDTDSFMLACKGNHVHLLELLLSYGANIESRDKNGNTALMLSSRYDYEECVLFLLNKKVDLNIKNNFGFNALMIASRYGFLGIAALLLRQDNIDLNAQSEEGASALIYACYYGYEHIAQLLLNKEGININDKGVKGNTALMQAVYNGHENIVRLLLQYKADIYIANDSDEKPLALARKLGHTRIAEILDALENVH